jgi:phytoene synthase
MATEEQSNATAVRDAARTLSFDRYLSALLAPPAVRSDLIAIAAYVGELARIPLTVIDPQIAEIRLEWWRGAVEGFAAGVETGNPVADAVGAVARKYALPQDILMMPIEGRSRELYEDGIPDEPAFEAYLDETEGAAFRLALGVLGGPAAGTRELLCHTAASALGRAGLALTVPRLLAKGRLPFPPREAAITGDPRQLAEGPARAAARSVAQALSRDARRDLAAFRANAKGLPAKAFPAFLPLALIEPYLRAIESPRHDALTGLAEISPLTRVFRLWLAHWRGRI